MLRSYVPDVRHRRVAMDPRQRTGFGTSMADLAGILDEFWKTPLDGVPFIRDHIEGGLVPALNVRETGEAFEISVELPGVESSDISVTIDKGVLQIKGEKQFVEEKQDGENEVKESGTTWHRVERRYGSFTRSLTLPAPVKEDSIAATFTNGVLHLSLPKAAEETARKIEISS